MSRSSDSNRAANYIATLLVVLLAVLFIGGRHLIRGEDVVQVTKTEQRCEAGTNCKYLVFTDKGVFENVDSKILELKWNSSDIYGELVAGRQYRIRYYGVRFGFFSWYPNITTVEAVSK